MAGSFRDTAGLRLAGYSRTFSQFTVGQKLVAVLGTAALLLGGFMVFRWASAPSMAPLYSDLSASDASAVVDELDAQGVKYELADGGTMIMVPRDVVYQTRIDLSAQGIPEGSDGGYSLLDNQGLATSDFQEQTDFKRAMEGELANTIEAIDGVDTAVVHLALPKKEVFSDSQQPATASVLVDTKPGVTLEQQQVQAVVNLVAASVEGLDPGKVTVADSSGAVLSAPGGESGVSSMARDQRQAAVETELHDRLQAMLDRVVGPGNSTVQVTAQLDFDSTDTKTTDYQVDKASGPSSTATSKETYKGPAGSGVPGGVVGPDGQMDPTATTGSGSSAYVKQQETADTPVDVVEERRQTPPGAIKTLHVGVALDAASTQNYLPQEVQQLVADTIGIDKKRGDTVRVAQMPFNRSVEDAASSELATARAAEASAATREMIRTGLIAALVMLVAGIAWLRARSRAKARRQATTYVVEQIRQESASRAAVADQTALLALEQSEPQEVSEEDKLRDELDALIERQPDDVASLLRGWLTERA
ncbi:flagellar basal-body MS-ring/collar protein FliF [Nocardioides rubriscoriae]|uniref:flagellar basal-body MS-ring/collar protein FliF n=1 Tax=Nocardioides rubriscoriae TaxID=642762 RepID=UPI0011DFCE17|nr:flagellar basal-body MS-ring/collar protein FliF [Nocardioides rubriscoriae]